MKDVAQKFQRLLDVNHHISEQRDYPSLFKLVVAEAINILEAEGGTLYLFNELQHSIEAVVVLNEPLEITHVIENFAPVSFKGLFGLSLPEQRGQPSNSVAATCWAMGKPIIINDVRNEHRFDMASVLAFDKKSNYETKTIVAIPLLARDRSVLGIVQLVNAPTSAFEKSAIEFVEAVTNNLGMALEINMLLRNTETLLYSVVSMISTAIDQKSRTTGGHCERVTELMMLFVKEMQTNPAAPLGDLVLDNDKINEIKIASDLHDVGKIATPDFVLEKSLKLEKTSNRLSEIEGRFKLRQAELRIQQLEEALTKSGAELPEVIENDEQADLEFLRDLNTGSEFIGDEQVQRVAKIAERKVAGKNLLTENEVHNLTIARGTLTPKERKIMESHASITIKLLERLPWPKNLARVPEIAGKHHESINGKGYPNQITGEQMSIPARMLAIVDRFEGLSAIDRNYRASKPLSEVIRIMDSMCSNGEIDVKLYEFFKLSNLHMLYAKKYLPPELIDIKT